MKWITVKKWLRFLFEKVLDFNNWNLELETEQGLQSVKETKQELKQKHKLRTEIEIEMQNANGKTTWTYNVKVVLDIQEVSWDLSWSQRTRSSKRSGNISSMLCWSPEVGTDDLASSLLGVNLINPFDTLEHKFALMPIKAPPQS